MSLVREIQKRSRVVVPQVLAAALVGYFAYHTIEGDRGFWSLLVLKQEVAEREAARDAVALKLERLGKRVALLRPENLDPDMLEERARIVLNYGRNEDLVFLRNPQ
ncbi:FtsB family cell division protein [Kiloniella sp. b19]|uniref:FtsB family cell division protein n=1 Tax=Kiloniella sp. GXU_MW_B19 TaxID=3141326 RepID=UPI0031D57CBA